MTTVVTDWLYIARACSADEPAFIIRSVKSCAPTTVTPKARMSSPRAADARAARANRVAIPRRRIRVAVPARRQPASGAER